MFFWELGRLILDAKLSLLIKGWGQKQARAWSTHEENSAFQEIRNEPGESHFFAYSKQPFELLELLAAHLTWGAGFACV